MVRNNSILCTACAVALMGGAPQAWAQSTDYGQNDQRRSDDQGRELEEIIVTGIRGSLTQAADIKRNADQVVDSIVADDIGKFPDNTTAGALQRVPGVQVTVGNNNEIVNPIIRGLGDILTTLNGREIFTGAGRGFSFQDLPAEALAGADVYKTNSADLIEGGVAGVIDLKLHRPFNFEDFTLAASAKSSYSREVENFNPTVGLLLTDRWNTDAGEMGALLYASYSDIDYNRPIAFNSEQRSTNFPPFGAPGYAAPTNVGGLNNYGAYERPQVNASLQWYPSDNLELYADGLYAGYRDEHSTAFVLYDSFSATAFTNVVDDGNCDDYLVAPHLFYDPNGEVQSLCNVESMTANNILTLTSNQAHDQKTDLYMIAGGAKYTSGAFHLSGDVSWQRSKFARRTFIIDLGKAVPSVDIITNVGGGTNFNAPGNPLGDPDDFRFTNGLHQDNANSIGELFAAKADAQYDLDGVLQNVQAGVRIARRDAVTEQVIVSGPAPGGSYATLVSSVDLPDDFLMGTPGIPQANGGAPFIIPNTEHLLDLSMQNRLKEIYGLPQSVPPYDPTRSFDAVEDTYAAYVQTKYELPLGDSVLVDGLIGLRATRTDRTIEGAGTVVSPDGEPMVVPESRNTSDTEYLPNFSARFRFGEDWQARLAYSRTLSRPAFGSLNPGLNYIVSTNPNVVNSGSSGNPDLLPEIADSYDATIEYYFGNSNYVSAGVYYKDIQDRVVGSVDILTIAGISYQISRPRNVGGAVVNGVEMSGQYFFDFLPGPWSGLGIFGNYTIADSEITTESDSLEGFELLGVSKYNYNVGLLYETSELSVRTVYTHRSEYFDEDRTASFSLRPVGQTIFLNGVRPNGRLDLSINYNLTSDFTVTFDATNLTRSKYRSYYDIPLNPRDIRNDDSFFSLGVRYRH